MATNLTAATISRTLAAAGHARSSSYSGRVRGYRSHTKGFTAKGTGTVYVEHENGEAVYRRENTAKDRAYLARYADTLRKAGYTAEIIAPNGESADYRQLRVTR